MMKKNCLLLTIVFLTLSCSENVGFSEADGVLESQMKQVTQWPHKVSGVLDIVEAGGYDDTDYPNWAVGSLVTAEDEYGVMIDIGAGVVAEAGIDIDSGEVVTVWLGAPTTAYGSLTYPVTRIEKP